MRRVLAVVSATVCAAAALSGVEPATGRRDVLVVVNAANADSVRIGEYYATKRGVPGEQVLRLANLPADAPDEISRVQFEGLIQAPIASWLNGQRAQDRILYLVLIKGIPLRVKGSHGAAGSTASVDSELTLLYRRLLGVGVPADGPVRNPYFLGERAIAEAKPFTRRDVDTYLVTRLDGFTPADAIALIDRAQTPAREGRVLLDGRSARNEPAQRWLRQAQQRLSATSLGRDRVVLDESTTVLGSQSDVLGYFSWGSNDPAIHTRTFDLKFRPGALAVMFVGNDARTFRPPPPSWRLGRVSDRATWFAGSPDSLAGDLIHEGVTGLGAQVGEPLLANAIRPDVVFPAYLAGFSLAESFYLGMPALSWQAVVLGDPLCAPFRERLAEPEPEPPIDSQTELPQEFSRRRLAVLSNAPNVNPDMLQAFVRADGLRQRGESDRAREGFERLTKENPNFLLAWYALGDLDSARGDYDAAILRYRHIISVQPDAVVALNDLAYALATRKGEFDEALSFAERALARAPRSGSVADTVGWIHYLRGDYGRALPFLTDAVRLSPEQPEVRWHLALAYDAVGNTAASKRERTAALALDPDIAGRMPTDAQRKP